MAESPPYGMTSWHFHTRLFGARPKVEASQSAM